MKCFILLAVALLVASVTSQRGLKPDCGDKQPEALCCEGEETVAAHPDEVNVLDCENCSCLSFSPFANHIASLDLSSRPSARLLEANISIQLET